MALQIFYEFDLYELWQDDELFVTVFMTIEDRWPIEWKSFAHCRDPVFTNEDSNVSLCLLLNNIFDFSLNKIFDFSLNKIFDFP